MNNTNLVLNGTDTDIYLLSQFSIPVSIRPSFIPSLSGQQNVNLSFVSNYPYSETNNIIIAGNNTILAHQFGFNATKNLNFTLVPTAIIVNGICGETNLTFYSLLNNGNADIIIENKTIVSNSVAVFSIGFEIPVNCSGFYTFVKNHTFDGVAKMFNLTVNAFDRTKPNVIYSYNKNVSVTDKVDFTFTKADNVGVSSFNLTIGDVKFTNLGGSLKFTPTSAGTQKLLFEICDTSGNCNRFEDALNVNPLDCREKYKLRDINFGAVAYTTASLQEIFAQFQEKTNLTVKVSTYNFGGDNKSLILLYGSKVENLNNSFELLLNNFEGGLGIRVPQTNMTMDFNAELNLDLPSVCGRDEDVRVRGSLKNYTVCKDTTINLFKYPFSFKASDTGNYETSKCIGTMEYPIDLDTNQSFILVSADERSTIFKEQTAQIEFFRNKMQYAYSQRNWLLRVLALGGIGFVLKKKIWDVMS